MKPLVLILIPAYNAEAWISNQWYTLSSRGTCSPRICSVSHARLGGGNRTAPRVDTQSVLACILQTGRQHLRCAVLSALPTNC
jgi:hypothetical protein